MSGKAIGENFSSRSQILQTHVPALATCKFCKSGTIVVSVRSGARMLDKQLLKVWGWFFQTAVHGKASPKDAQLFTAPADRSPPLRHVSGVGGLYVESRDVSGRSPRQGEQDIDILGLAIHKYLRREQGGEQDIDILGLAIHKYLRREQGGEYFLLMGRFHPHFKLFTKATNGDDLVM